MSNIPNFFGPQGFTPPPQPQESPNQIQTALGGNSENRVKWRIVADDFFQDIVTKEKFVQTFTGPKPEQIPLSWINTFIESLELSAEQGVPFNQFISYWRLLPNDFPNVLQKHANLTRAIQVAREKRKKAFTDSVMAKAHTSPVAAMKALESEEFVGDVLSEEDEKNASKTIEDQAEELLIQRGIEPCEYAQVVMLQGETPTLDHVKHQDHDLIGLSPQQVISLLSKPKVDKNAKVDIPTQKPTSKWKFQLPPTQS